MGLASMRRRLDYRGGAVQQDRMIKNKLRSMLYGTRQSYQAAKFHLYLDPRILEDLDEELRPLTFSGLFNPSRLTEDLDTKIISVPFESLYRAGSIITWENTNTQWIIFLQELTELAYFRGNARRCNWKVQWIDGNREQQEQLLAVIGPSINQVRSSSSMGIRLSQDFPNANLRIMVPDTERNREFFHRYQNLVIEGYSYQINIIDRLSMPGIIQFTLVENYTNLIEEDVEGNLMNAWNVLPVIPDPVGTIPIQGPHAIKPRFNAKFWIETRGGRWVVIENLDTDSPLPIQIIPLELIDPNEDADAVSITWTSMVQGGFTLGYIMPNGDLVSQRFVVVESLM